MEGFPKKETIIELCLDREYTSDIYSPEKRWNFFKSCTIEEVIYSSMFILDKSHILMAKRSQNRILLYLRWSKFVKEINGWKPFTIVHKKLHLIFFTGFSIDLWIAWFKISSCSDLFSKISETLQTFSEDTCMVIF